MDVLVEHDGVGVLFLFCAHLRVVRLGGVPCTESDLEEEEEEGIEEAQQFFNSRDLDAAAGGDEGLKLDGVAWVG